VKLFLTSRTTKIPKPHQIQLANVSQGADIDVSSKSHHIDTRSVKFSWFGWRFEMPRAYIPYESDVYDKRRFRQRDEGIASTRHDGSVVPQRTGVQTLRALTGLKRSVTASRR
jgi:hypothetical protein